MPRLVIDIVGDTSKLTRAFRQAERETRTFSARMGQIAKVGIFAGAAAGAASFGVAVRAGFKELAEGQKAAAQTAAALKSTGAVAGVTAAEIEKLAGSLQQLSGYDDEAIQSAENLILTFTNVRNVAGKNNDIFNQTALATLNLSRRFEQDLSTSAVQLGKALQDPVRGLTSLRRIGVGFTEAQQKLIRRLVETGRTLEAQKIILREVERQVGGSAKAYGETFPGQLDILRGSLENLAGELATTLNPEVEKLTRQFNKWLENPENKQKIIDGWAAAVGGLGKAFKLAADTASGLEKAWGKLDKFLNPDWMKSRPGGIRVIGAGGPVAPAGPRGPIGAAAAAAAAARPGAVRPGVVDPAVAAARKAAAAAKKLADARKAAALARKAADDFETRMQTRRDWLDFGIERAEATKTIRDDRAAQQKLIAHLEDRIRQEGRKLELVRDIWRARQAIRDLNKSKAKADVDPLAGDVTGFRHMSPHKLAAQLGLSGAAAARGAALLSTVGMGGSMPGGRTRAFAGAGGVNITGSTLHFHGVQNVRDLEDTMAKVARGRAHTRRGAR